MCKRSHQLTVSARDNSLLYLSMSTARFAPALLMIFPGGIFLGMENEIKLFPFHELHEKTIKTSSFVLFLSHASEAGGSRPTPNMMRSDRRIYCWIDIKIIVLEKMAFQGQINLRFQIFIMSAFDDGSFMGWGRGRGESEACLAFPHIFSACSLNEKFR